MSHQVIYIMGVSGSGKTTIGQQLSARTGFAFYDADDFHTPENKAKMKAAIPLTDEDRWPWLDNIHRFVAEKIATESIVFVCSALRQVYRQRLSRGMEAQCRWVLLEGDYATIFSRLQKRQGHYMPPALLQSQFDTLEIPGNAIQVDIKASPEKIVNQVMAALHLS